MFLQKSCINFYISGELLHFNLHNFSECVNNACIKYARRSLIREGGMFTLFLIVLLACADWSKIFFQVLHKRRFHIYNSSNIFEEKGICPAALSIYISQYKPLVFGPRLIKYRMTDICGRFIIEPLYA